ncbi:MAG: hypothetical protein CVU56_22060 [Deltaproteobacteria bacterium HGW-Deltaproteobacteria-14]|nr:MAG: hypothetical protein CVU56_22060 [Deltaproteobacteria bacterium HGW-Deltaproteobacteria-14]
MSPLSCIAKVLRFFAGKKSSRSKTPRRSKGGASMSWMRDARSSACPRVHAWVRRFESRMYSRDCSGSASTSTSARTALTTPVTSSLWSSAVRVSNLGGGSKRSRRLTWTPELEPGV